MSSDPYNLDPHGLRKSGWPPLTPMCVHGPLGGCQYCTPGTYWTREWTKNQDETRTRESGKIDAHINIEEGRRRANVPTPDTDEVNVRAP